MTLPLLLYCSLLKKAQYKSLRDLSGVHQGAVDMSVIDKAMRSGVDKRLALAQEFLTFSETLSLNTTSEIIQRNAVSRAYYAVHHAVRALLLFEERGDVDGHREAIKTEDFRSAFLDLLERRHLADYYPYGTNAPNELPLDFAVAAQEAVIFARRVVEKTRDYITMKEDGKI